MKDTTAREAAAQNFADAVAELARVRTLIASTEFTLAQARKECDELADQRERALAVGETGAEDLRLQTALKASEVSDIAAKQRGLHALAPSVDAAIGPLAVALLEAWVAEYDADLAAKRAKLDAGNATESDVAAFDASFRELFWARSELHRCTGNLKFAPGSFDVRAELERRGLLALAPDHVRFAGAQKPRLAEVWRTPPVAEALEAYKAQREEKARLAMVAGHLAHAKQQAEQRALDPFGTPAA